MCPSASSQISYELLMTCKAKCSVQDLLFVMLWTGLQTRGPQHRVVGNISSPFVGRRLLCVEFGYLGQVSSIQ